MALKILIAFLIVSYGLLLGLSIGLTRQATSVTPFGPCDCPNPTTTQTILNVTFFIFEETDYYPCGAASGALTSIGTGFFSSTFPYQLYFATYDQTLLGLLSSFVFDLTGSGQWTSSYDPGYRLQGPVVSDAQFFYVVQAIYGIVDAGVAVSRFFISDGTLDTSIGVNGYLILDSTTSVGGDTCYPNSITTIGDNLYIGMQCYRSGNWFSATMKRSLPSLAPNTTFGDSDGITYTLQDAPETRAIVQQNNTGYLIVSLQDTMYALDPVTGALIDTYSATLPYNIKGNSGSSEMVLVTTNTEQISNIILDVNGNVVSQLSTITYDGQVPFGQKMCSDAYFQIENLDIDGNPNWNITLRSYFDAAANPSFGNFLFSLIPFAVNSFVYVETTKVLYLLTSNGFPSIRLACGG